jgi:porin
MKSRFRLSLLFLFLGACVTSARAQSAATGANNAGAPPNIPTAQAPPSPGAPNTAPGNPPAPVSAPTTLWTQNYLTGNWGGSRDQLKNDGVSFTPVYTGEVFGNPVGGARQGVISDGLFDLTLDVDLDPLTKGALKDTIFHSNALYIYGNSLSAQDVGDFSNTSNIAGFNTLRLQELWLQKLFWNKTLSLQVGNIAVDNEFFQSTSASLFLSGTFGAFTFLANNVAEAPVYPLASPGVRLQYFPTADTYVMTGVFGLDDAATQSSNPNGLRFALHGSSGLLIMSEAGYLLNQASGDKGLAGSYRVGSFANGTGPLRGAGTNYGIYGVVDQQLYAQTNHIISLFVRSGGAPSNTNFVDYYIEGGFNFTGFVPGRDNDIAGLALARSHLSDDYSAAQVAEGNPPSTAETVLEATYKIQLAPWWSLQPDLQYIITPSGVENSPNALALGLRTTVAF